MKNQTPPDQDSLDFIKIFDQVFIEMVKSVESHLTNNTLKEQTLNLFLCNIFYCSALAKAVGQERKLWEKVGFSAQMFLEAIKKKYP